MIDTKKAVYATPTKELFIDMLTRDIKLIPAIVDLVDNCTDGARRAGAKEDFSSYEVQLELDSKEFVIFDNCGGISIDDARNYAFRFGRPSDQSQIAGEIGRFGVGMKRALFKLGRHFVVWSTTKEADFVVEVDVDEWAKETGPEWTFPFAQPPTEDGTFKEPGTQIEVTRLYSSVSDRFEQETFIQELRRELSSRLRDPISKGFYVGVNGEPLESEPMKLLTSTALAPAKFTETYGSGRRRVRVVLYAGLGKSDSLREARRDAGWYVFCNGRLLMEADKTSDTVWGLSDEASGEEIPAFHNQFNSFRGFAYFTARDSRDLPWNTTKTGLDVDSDLYRTVRAEMINISRPVISFLNKVKNEKEARGADSDIGPLEGLIGEAAYQTLDTVTTRAAFRVPTAPKQKVAPRLARITYQKSISEVDAVKRSLGVRSNVLVGERTFAYYYKAECDDDEEGA